VLLLWYSANTFELLFWFFILPRAGYSRVAQQITAQMILLGLLVSARVALPNCTDPFKKAKEEEETLKDNRIRSACVLRNMRTKKMKRERSKEKVRMAITIISRYVHEEHRPSPRKQNVSK